MFVKIIKNWFLVVLFLLPLFLTRDATIDLVNYFWIEPIVSKINYENRLVVWSLITTIIFIYYNINPKLKNATFIVFLFLALWSLLTNYFWKLGWDSDSFFYIFILTIFTSFVCEPFVKEVFFKGKRVQRTQSTIEDEFRRAPFAKIIAEKIRKQKSEESYNIAIIGAWGSGKTHFINLIKNEFENSSNEIIEYFIPAEFKKGHDIIIPLLEKLKNDSKNILIEPNINELIVLLQQDSSSFIFKVTSFLFQSMLEKKTIQDIKDEISEILNKKEKRVIIFIDDFDRLEKDEILEVFRILRNTLNIANFYFIVGFDREYVSSKLDIERFDEYTEKFFQIRIDLPIIEDFEIENILIQELSKRLEISKIHSESIVSNIKHGYLYRMIKNKRDAINICENLSLIKEAIGNNCDLRILIGLEILRYKKPETYNYLATNMNDVLLKFKGVQDE
jgi:predicted KAP-like P-loop ATPase